MVPTTSLDRFLAFDPDMDDASCIPRDAKLYARSGVKFLRVPCTNPALCFPNPRDNVCVDGRTKS